MLGNRKGPLQASMLQNQMMVVSSKLRNHKKVAPNSKHYLSPSTLFALSSISQAHLLAPVT